MQFPCKKVRYGNAKFALEDLDRIQGKSTRSTVPFRVYLCKCGAWHLSSKPFRPFTKK